MCGRLTLQTPAGDLVSLFDDLTVGDLKVRYNICPTQPVLAVRWVDGRRQAGQLRWGLIPHWANDTRIGGRLFNARSETVAEKPSFRAAFRERRCLVIADGFYEWKTQSTGKQPYYISLYSAEPFFIAGLWETWSASDSNSDKAVESCTVITQPADSMMQTLHDRMPALLSSTAARQWLDGDFDNTSLPRWLQGAKENMNLQAWPVSKRVNKPDYDCPDCLQPVAAMRQKRLFD